LAGKTNHRWRVSWGKTTSVEDPSGGLSAGRASYAPRSPAATAYYPTAQRVPTWSLPGGADQRRSAGRHGRVSAALRREDAQLPIQPSAPGGSGDRSWQSGNSNDADGRIALMTCCVASLGIDGVVSIPWCRRKKIASAMAMGATAMGSSGWFFVRVWAVAIGRSRVGAAILLGQVIVALVGVRPLDPVAIAGVTAVLLMGGLG